MTLTASQYYNNKGQNKMEHTSTLSYLSVVYQTKQPLNKKKSTDCGTLPCLIHPNPNLRGLLQPNPNHNLP